MYIHIYIYIYTYKQLTHNYVVGSFRSMRRATSPNNINIARRCVYLGRQACVCVCARVFAGRQAIGLMYSHNFCTYQSPVSVSKSSTHVAVSIFG